MTFVLFSRINNSPSNSQGKSSSRKKKDKDRKRTLGGTYTCISTNMDDETTMLSTRARKRERIEKKSLN